MRNHIRASVKQSLRSAPPDPKSRAWSKLWSCAAVVALVAFAGQMGTHRTGAVLPPGRQGGHRSGPDSVFPADVPVAPRRPGSAVFLQSSGAARLRGSGLAGRGVNVAVLDTGIANLSDFAGRLVAGVDLSGENDPFQDSYGHGTFVAGLIAGNGASSQGRYTGVAPEAGLVAIKVAGRSGMTDTATVIKGIDWAIAHRQPLGIGVLNISMGTVPQGSSILSPIDQAVERAWRSGIVVVVSAGNAGSSNGTILSPGDDPLIITVGALDDQGTVGLGDDTMASFSSAGPTAYDARMKPDLVAAGQSVISLRSPASTIDDGHPTARIGNGNFVGSGTSFSAAITSGAAALVLQAKGGRPDEVKERLLATAVAGPADNIFVNGHGALDVYSAATASTSTLRHPRVLTPTQGAPTRPGDTWNGSSWNGSSWNGSSWNGSSWNGSSWNGSSWN